MCTGCCGFRRSDIIRSRFVQLCATRANSHPHAERRPGLHLSASDLAAAPVRGIGHAERGQEARALSRRARDLCDPAQPDRPRKSLDGSIAMSAACSSVPTRQYSDDYSALRTDIGVSRTALTAGTSEPANVIRSATPTPVANVAGSLGATPKSSALIPRAAA